LSIVKEPIKYTKRHLVADLVSGYGAFDWWRKKHNVLPEITVKPEEEKSGGEEFSPTYTPVSDTLKNVIKEQKDTSKQIIRGGN
jgi:hypothetical protein